MDSFDVVNTELVIVAVTLALLFFLVRRAVGGGGHAIGPSARGRGRSI